MNFIDESLYKDKIGIYQIVNTINGMCYIGQTKERFVRRYWHHKWLLQNQKHFNQHLQNDWNVYGANAFKFEVLQVVDVVDILDTREQYFIAVARKHNCSYNLQDGGKVKNMAAFISPETYKHIGEKNRQRMLGTKHSEETKEKMSNSRRGSKNAFAKLTEDDVRNIKRRIARGERPIDICRLYNITYGNLKMIRSGKTWSHVII